MALVKEAEGYRGNREQEKQERDGKRELGNEGENFERWDERAYYFQDD